MRRTMCSYAGLLFSMLLISLIAFCSSANSVVRIGTFEPHRGNFKPYMYFDEEGEVTGSVVDTLVCSAEKMGFTVKLVAVPWERATRQVETGRVDGIFPASASLTQPVQTFVTAPLLYSEYGLVRLNDTSLSSIQKVGIMRGNQVSKRRMAGSDYQVVEISSYDQLLDMLKVGFIDAAHVNLLAIELHNQNNPSGLELIPFEKHAAPLMAMFNQQFLQLHPHFIQGFNKNLRYCQK